MKKLFNSRRRVGAICSFLLVMFSSPPIDAQSFTCTVQNSLVSGTDFLYEIYVQRTGLSDIYLGNSDFVLTFDNASFASPTISIVQPGIPGGRIEAFYGVGAVIVSSNRAVVNVSRPVISSQTQFDSRLEVISTLAPGTLIAIVKITGISNPAGSANLQWRLDVPNNTVIHNSTPNDPPNFTQFEITSQGTFTDPPSIPLPIQLASFASTVIRDNDVEVAWKTVSETNNYGFEVYRKRGERGAWTKLAFIEGHGTTLVPQSYSYLDHSISFGKYFYQIKQVDLDGKAETFPEMEVTVGVGPGEFVLAQNYPNPFNPSTSIEFILSTSGHATLNVYNLLGQEVATLFRGELAAGIHSVEWSPRNLANGVYVYRLEVEGGPQHFVATRRLVLLK
jgi:hypothetical protein